MRSLVIAAAAAVPLLAWGAVASPALAANAKHPYSHINKANDKGNAKGDAEVTKLNQQQLDQINSGQK